MHLSGAVLAVGDGLDFDDEARLRVTGTVDALSAFGEAIATVARARLISCVALGHGVVVELDDYRSIELFVVRDYVELVEHTTIREQVLWRLDGAPEDVAAEAVTQLVAHTQSTR